MIYKIQFLLVVLFILTIASNAFHIPASRGVLMKPLRMALESSSKPSHLRVGIFGGIYFILLYHICMQLTVVRESLRWYHTSGEGSNSNRGEITIFCLSLPNSSDGDLNVPKLSAINLTYLTLHFFHPRRRYRRRRCIRTCAEMYRIRQIGLCRC